MTFQHTELFERCRAIVRATKITDAFGETYCSVGTQGHERQYRCIEHTFHELAHAVLLGLPPLTFRLSEAVGRLLEARPQDASDNEADTFAVCTLLFDRFGIEYDQLDIVESLERQISAARRELAWKYIAALRDTQRVQLAAEIVADVTPGTPQRAPIRKILRRSEQFFGRDTLHLDCGHSVRRNNNGGYRALCFDCLIDKPNCTSCGLCCLALSPQPAFTDVTPDDEKRLGKKFVRLHVIHPQPFDHLLSIMTGNSAPPHGAIATKSRQLASGPLAGQHVNACTALDGTPMDTVSCSVYERRPAVCRDAVRPGDQTCHQVRQLYRNRSAQ